MQANKTCSVRKSYLSKLDSKAAKAPFVDSVAHPLKYMY